MRHSSTYASPLEVYSGYLPAIQGATSASLRGSKTGKSDPQLRGWLEDMALRSNSPEWRE